MSDNIKVAIKVRPLIKREKDERLPIQWIVEENSILQIDPTTNRRSDAGFQFDYIFDMGRSNQDVFDATVKPIVEAAMRGFNGTIFAYGQTGSGKTYTMMGTKEERGVIPLAVDYIFNYIRNDPDREFLLRVSYIEIYNERINDLLDKNRTDLKVKEDYHGHISIDCKEEVTNSATCVLGAMKKGDKNRRTGETNMNERSSRSHTLFRITIESCAKDDPDGTANEAQLNLIDLAGSERARQTGATGERFNEGRHINLSLSTLSLVIKQLSESQNFINFRDSKLTRILQPSLGGNAMTAIICAVTPAADDETQCTLAFAVRAKGIKNKPQVNENISDKALLKRIRTQKLTLEAEMANMKTEMAEKDKQILLGRIALMNMAILTSSSSNEEEFKVKARRRRTWAGSSSGGPNPSGKNFALPTIDECELKSDTGMDELIQQRNIYEMDVLNQSFQTAFADFELQLIEDQREKNRLSNGSDGGFIAPTVTTRPRIIVEDIDDDENINVCSPERTPERSSSSSDPSPSTPKIKLREKLDTLRSEYDKLREFTTLEKQLLQTDCIAAANQAQYEKNLSYITRSLADSEQMCKDLSKKYAELQSDHAILTEKYEASERKCAILNEDVQSLSSIRDTLTSLEFEKNDYKSKMNAALIRQKCLEDESTSHTFEIDSLKSKHKTREKELEASLNLAWQEFTDPNEKQKFTDIVHLQSVISELTTKISSLELQLQSNSNATSISFTEDDFILKIDELDKSLRQSQAENLSLKAKLSETSDHINTINEIPLENEFQTQIEEYIKRIEELEQIIAQKDLELANNNNNNLTLKFNEANDKLHIYERRIEEMKIDIEKLQIDLDKKSNELCEIKIRLDVTLKESDKVYNDTQLQLTTIRERLEAALCTIEDKDAEIQEMKHILLQQKTSETNTNQSTIVDNKSENSIIANTENEYNKLLGQIEEQNLEIVQLKKQMEDVETNSVCVIKSHQEKINRLVATNEKLRDQIANIVSEKTMYDGDRTAMQTLIQEKDEQLQIIPKLNNQLEFMTCEKMEFERIINDQRTQLNEKMMAIEKMQNYESEINNLNSYNENLQSFVKKLQDENEEMKKELECQANSLKMLEHEKESLISQLDSFKIGLSDVTNVKDTSRCDNVVQNTSFNDSKSTPRVSQVVKPFNIPESPQSTKQIQAMKNIHDVTHDDKESSSIFANGSYFDNMDMSVAACEPIDSSCTQDLSNIDCTISNTTVMETRLELDNSKVLLNLTCDELENCLAEKNSQELINIVKELLNLKTTLEEENAKLALNLQSKIRETVGIRKDFGAFKLDFEKLQQTILLLTTENSDMTGKLTIEKERANEIQTNLQKHIDELKIQIETLMTEKQEQEINIKMLKEKLDNVENSVAIFDEEKIKKIAAEYESKIQTLTDENIDLSNNLMDKIEELENIRDKNREQCGEDCSFREKWEHIVERVKILQNENVDLTNRLMEKIEEFNIITEKYDILEKNSLKKSNNYEELPTKVDALVHSANELKILIAKLLDSKIMCQCTIQQTELNETQYAIKNNMEELNARWHDFQDNFERARAEAEKLTNKAQQDINNSIHETSMNSSVLFENVDITFVEEKVQRLQSDFEILHDSLQRWSMLNEKTYDAEKLREINTSILDISRSSPCESPRTSKRDAKIDRRQCELEKYKIEQQQLAKTINAFEKFQNSMTHMQHEIKILRTARDTYEAKIKIAEEFADRVQQRVLILEEDVTVLNNQLDQSLDNNKKLNELKLNLENEIEILKHEKENYEVMSNELRQSLIEAKDSNVLLQNKLEELEMILNSKIQDLTNSLHNSEASNIILTSELNAIKSTPIPEPDQVINLTSQVEKYKENIESLETSVKELREKLSCYAKENSDLCERIAKLQAPVNKSNLNVSDNNMEICDESFTQNSSIDKSIEELANARACITKEIAALQDRGMSNFDGKSLSELFSIFLTTLMAKENEIIKTLHESHENEKHKLIEKNKQSIDAEKRSSAWAKELEADIERLQNDLSKQEIKNTTLITQISKLESSLLDSEHEKQLLKEKIAVMETDFNALQADYDKHFKPNSPSDETTNEREKSLQQAIETREIEYKTKLVRIENEHKKKIEELSNSLEISKTKNMDLKKELEALEANERQLKSIIDLKTSELTKSNSTAQRLQTELKELSEIYNQTNDENHIKQQKIEEITALLKTKCDKMSEYKTHLETIKPEYEMLKVQASERQLRLETYKNEMEKLREDNEQQILSLKDQLDSQEIKSTIINKQLIDITNRNTIIQSELEQMNDKYQEVQRENERLMKKIRNSTSKLTVEREMADLHDANRTHLKNLEGATNRIVELQKLKSQLMIEHAELQGRYDNVCRENNELKNILDKSKIANNDKLQLDDKYDTLLQEKNKIALELEERRSKMIQLETNLERLTRDNVELKDKNVELDAEMDDIVKKIHEMDEENTELQRRIYEMENDNRNTDSNKKSSMINNSNLNNSKLLRYEDMKKELQVITMTNEVLKKENAEFKCKIGNRNEGKSCASSRSVSPTPTNRSRQKRSDLFNQNRPLDGADDDDVDVVIPPIDCQCEELKKQIRKLEQDLVSKQARIATLQLQIRNKIFPYTVKCKELEDAMLEYQKRNTKLLAENNELRMRKIDCTRCTSWTLFRRDESSQTSPEKPKLFLSGSSRSGIVEEHSMEQMQITKLERDKGMLKTKLKRKLEEKQKMQEQIQELQSQLDAFISGGTILDKNYKHVMKENVPANITGQTKLIVPQRNRFN